MDNTTDMLSTRPTNVLSEMQVLMEAGMTEASGEAGCAALHGLGLVLTVTIDGTTRKILFDAGPDGYGIRRNGTAMGLEFGDIEAMALSHGHYDHSNGLLTALELIRESNGDQEVPFYVHPGAFVHRALRTMGGAILRVQDVPSIESFEEVGAKVILSTESEELCDGAFFLSGEIPRTSFEDGYRNHLRLQENGEWAPDPLVIDERFVVVHVRRKGLVVFTGCSHAGIINILSEVESLFPNIPLYGVIGGLHLSAVNEDRIPMTVNAMRQFDPKMLIVGHCTGWRAVHAVVEEFGEAIVDPLSVGSRHTIRAADA